MRILLDNCVDRRLAGEIRGYEVRSTADEGWGSLGNGELLRTAAARFDVMVTIDKNLKHQQNLARLPLPVVELDAARSHVDELRRFLPFLPAALALSKSYRFVLLSSDGKCDPREPAASG